MVFMDWMYFREAFSFSCDIRLFSLSMSLSSSLLTFSTTSSIFLYSWLSKATTRSSMLGFLSICWDNF